MVIFQVLMRLMATLDSVVLKDQSEVWMENRLEAGKLLDEAEQGPVKETMAVAGNGWVLVKL